MITPYLAQARLLRDAAARGGRAGLEIGTVDGFQGREKEAVIVDLVRSNDDGEVGFLADTRRMNVAHHTRAQLPARDRRQRDPAAPRLLPQLHGRGRGIAARHLSAWADDAEPFS